MEIEKLPKGNPPKYPVSQLILVWGKKNPHMGPRDIVDPNHPAYDADIDDPDIWDKSTYYGQKFESMVQSMLIEVDGILQGIRVPLSVAKDGSQDGYVVAGRWRTLAGREAENRSGNKIVIQAPFMYVPLTDHAIKRQMVLENMNGNRNLKPTRRAAYVAILESHGANREEIMTACGVTSWQAVENIKKLNDLAPEVKALVDNKEITQTEARAIADKPKAEQKKIVESRTTGTEEKSDDKRVSPKDMRRITDYLSKDQSLDPIIIGAYEMLCYLTTGDANKLNQSVRALVFDALKAGKRGPQSKPKTDASEATYQIQLAAVKQNGWVKRAKLMESIHEWQDEGQENCNNPDSPDYHCIDEEWFEDMAKRWRSAYAKREDQTMSEGTFLKDWIRGLKE